MVLQQTETREGGQKGLDIGRSTAGRDVAQLAEVRGDFRLVAPARQEFEDNCAGRITTEDRSSAKVENDSAIRIGHRSEICRETQHCGTPIPVHS